MPAVDPKRISDGFLSLEGGVNSGVTPNLLKPNQIAWGVNLTTRDGWAMPRPGWQLCDVDWHGETEAQADFQNGRFQVAGPYITDAGNGYLMCSVGGQQFSFALGDGHELEGQEITIANDPNSSVLEQAWCCQAENYWLLQNNEEKCFIWNGATGRRAGKYEIPTGKQITYFMGRIWVARGREYVAGNIVFGPKGRAEILDFTENTYLYEGGAFAVPAQFGDITAFKPIASINTALGQGELVTYTHNGVFATVVPQDRATWVTTANPIQRVIQLRYGAFSQNAVVDHNEDHYYRSPDGIRSLVYAVRNSGQPGNTAISHEIERALVNDASELLKYGSAVVFDGRLLMTVAPHFEREHGIWHEALVVLDFEPLNSVSDKTPPTYDGIWRGTKILQILTVTHKGVDRCFMFTLNANNKIEIWEMSRNERFDADDVPISWLLESRSMDFGNKFDRHSLMAADVFYDRVAGDVSFTVQYRPDSYPCWLPWDSWTECSKYRTCSDDNQFLDCPTIQEYKETYRINRQLVQPPDTFDSIMLQMFREGFEHQVRLCITGHCRLKQVRLNAYEVQQPPYGEQL